MHNYWPTRDSVDFLPWSPSVCVASSDAKLGPEIDDNGSLDNELDSDDSSLAQI